MGKQCELCQLPARMFCESDEANLCWECDAKVHGANFLVARHSRRLLCRSCQAPTPWRASGSRLGSTVSICNRCCLGDNGAETSDSGEATRDGAGGGEGGRRGGLVEGDMEGGGGMGEEDEEEGSEEIEDNYEDEDDDEYAGDDEDGDNQVVPWSTEADAEVETASPRPVASCSSSDESSSGGMDVYYGLLKRRREDDDPPSSHWQEDSGCSPSQHGYLRFSSPPPAVGPEA
ncbi:hypothetical protein Taro_030483 [Colocasia esculenta]|uniref:B box-type domain-containing protein n=1 Tax=Colocasia esculenta TaxID=4460 RepID=A0A843VS09_COLES|nr:hypothetical protein [Colocasia esculenta]